MTMAQQVLRIDESTHKDVSHYAVKCGKKMTEVSDEIVRAGLAALAGDHGPAKVVAPAEEVAPPAVGTEARDSALILALDAESAELVRAYRDEIAARPKRAETLTMWETAGRLITTGWNRLVAVQKHQGSRT